MKVAVELQLLERDYFGLVYKDHYGVKTWVEQDKWVSKQLRSKYYYLWLNFKDFLLELPDKYIC